MSETDDGSSKSSTQHQKRINQSVPDEPPSNLKEVNEETVHFEFTSIYVPTW